MKYVVVEAANVAKPEGRGTRHFREGQKVYLVPQIWGDGGERRYVRGRFRGKGRWTTVVVARAQLRDVREQRVYDPAVVAYFVGQWSREAHDDPSADAPLSGGPNPATMAPADPDTPGDAP